MENLDRPPDITPPRPDRGARTRPARVWAYIVLGIALGVQAVLGIAALFVGGFGGDMVGRPLIGAWVVATSVLVLVLVMIGRHRWRPATAWVGIAAVAVTILAFPVSAGPLQDLQACTDSRRTAVMTVAPYGGRSVEVSGGQYGCGYSLNLQEPVAPIVRYYREGFERAGWTVTTGEDTSVGQSEGGGTVTAGELSATNGDATVSIVYEGTDDGTYASVSLVAT